jgi:hypothetical protein
VGPGPSLEVLEKRKMYCSWYEPYHGSLVNQPVVQSVYRLAEWDERAFLKFLECALL